MTHMQQPKNQSKKNRNNLKKLLLEQVFVILCFSLFFLIGAFIAFLLGAKEAQCFYFACGALQPASFLSAALLAKRAGKNGLVVGLEKSAFSILAVIVASLVSTGFRPDLRLPISASILFLSAAIGGIAGVNMKNKPRHTHGKGR